MCKETRLEGLSLAENCFASLRKYHGQENASVSCESLEINLPKLVKKLLDVFIVNVGFVYISH